jgi:putative transposase
MVIFYLNIFIVSRVKMNLRSHHHVVYKLTYHLVLVTKYRHKCITKEMLEYLKEVINDNLAKNDIILLDFNGESDHIHLQVEAHPSMELSKIVNNLKTVSSRMVRKKYKTHLDKYYWKPYFWKRGYCVVSTGGASLNVVSKYINEKQDSPESHSSDH